MRFFPDFVWENKERQDIWETHLLNGFPVKR